MSNVLIKTPAAEQALLLQSAKVSPGRGSQYVLTKLKKNFEKVLTFFSVHGIIIMERGKDLKIKMKGCVFMTRTEIRTIALKFFAGWLREANEIFEAACYGWDAAAINAVEEWAAATNLTKSDLYTFFLTLF